MMGCMHVRWIVSWRCLLKESATWIIWAMEGANWIRTRIGFQSGTMRSARKCVRGTRNHLQMWKFVRILIKIIWCWDFPKKSISAKFCFQKYIPYENILTSTRGGCIDRYSGGGHVRCRRTRTAGPSTVRTAQYALRHPLFFCQRLLLYLCLDCTCNVSMEEHFILEVSKTPDIP